MAEQEASGYSTWERIADAITMARIRMYLEEQRAVKKRLAALGRTRWVTVWPCPECGRPFGGRRYLERHRIVVHRALPALGALLLAAALAGALAAWAEGPQLSPTRCTIEWDEPQTNTDGSTLTDLASYRLYLATSPGAFTTPIVTVPAPAADPEPGSVVQWDCTAAGLADGQYWLSLRAVDATGNESPGSVRWENEAGEHGTDGIPFSFNRIATIRHERRLR